MNKLTRDEYSALRVAFNRLEREINVVSASLYQLEQKLSDEPCRKEVHDSVCDCCGIISGISEEVAKLKTIPLNDGDL